MRAVILVSLLVFALVTGKSMHGESHEKGHGRTHLKNSHERSHGNSQETTHDKGQGKIHGESHEKSADDKSGFEHLQRKCGCKFEDKPVCATMKDGSQVDFESPCKARCGGAEHFTDGLCETVPIRLCGCPPGGNPVCGTVNGERVEFENHCKAGCADAEDITEGYCETSEVGEPAYAYMENPFPLIHESHDSSLPEIDEPKEDEEPDVTRDDMVALGMEEDNLGEEQFLDLESEELQVNSLEKRDLVQTKRDVIHINTGKGKHCGHKKHSKKVCGEMPDGKRKTFKNKCKAEQAGAINIKKGKCKCHKKPHKHCHSHEDSHSHEVLPPLCGCPPFGDPVCGHFADGSKKDFENGCHASCAGARAIINGNCATPPLCGCPRILDPVCGRMADGFLQDFVNHCEAGCGGAGEITRGKCHEEDDHHDDEHEDLPSPPPLCGCPPFGDPVCGHFPDGSKKDFENGCHASCAGARAIIQGTCARPPLCGCPFINDPVCGRMADGFLQDFDNHCVASCGGANDITQGPCHSEKLPVLCGCPPIHDPVCGTMADGSKKDFDNRCQAGCGGAKDVTEGVCEEHIDTPVNPPFRLCGCPPIDAPVCGTMPDGSKRDFSSHCHAGCADATDIVDGHCNDDAIPMVKKCGCPFEDKPVCGFLEGSFRNFPNRCTAGCSGATDISDGVCPDVSSLVHEISHPAPIRLCGCKPVDMPVCGKMPDGSLKDFPNHCEAGCKDATDIKPGKCAQKKVCACHRMLLPVCGTLPDGSKKGFSNDCLAKCEDATNITPGSCPGEEGHESHIVAAAHERRAPRA